MDISKEEIFILKLKYDELKWLKSVMQNPLHNQHPDEENLIDRKYRELFWKTLNKD
jgi:hypothetical protein